ncbi:MAG: Ig-like domain-containing protein [bacterium]
MASRKLILFFVFLSFGWTVFARTTEKIRLSPILQIWNAETQELEFLFNIVNKSDQAVDLSYIVYFNSRQGKGWQDQPTVRLEANSSQLTKMSYKLNAIRIGDFISTSVILYGPDFKGQIDQADQYFEVTAVEVLPGGTIELDFSEELPRKQSVLVPEDTMSRIVKQLIEHGEQTLPGKKKSGAETEKKKIFMTVLSTLPVDQTRKVEPETPITVTLSEPIARESVTPESFFLLTASGNMKNRKVEGTLVITERQLSFVPQAKLQFGAQYQAVLSNRIRSQAGNTLKKAYAWQFEVKKIPVAKLFGPAKQYLKVLMVSPRVKGLNILTDTKIQLKLSGIIDPGTVNQESFYVSWKGGKVETEFKTSRDQITLTPKKPLENGVVYTAVATPGIKDETGKSLKMPIKWQFQTRAAIEYPETEDPNLLIFSPSHEPVSYVKEKQGILKIGITAFSSVLHADVNGVTVSIPQDTQVEFELPYSLKSKSTPFEITAYTNQGKARKKFIIHFGEKPKPRKPAFQLISILSAVQVDNLNNRPSGSSDIVTATKGVLTIVPQYELKIRDQSVLRIKGILLREKYAKDEYQNRETSYSQAAIEWEERKTFLGTVIAGVGWNFIRMNNNNFIGENGISEETFFNCTVKDKTSKTGGWEIGLEYKNKDATADAANIDNETDGTEVTLRGSVKFGLGSVDNKTKISYSLNDAVGKYQDYTSASAAYTISAPIGNFTPSLGYTYKFKQMKIFNPTENARPEYGSGSISAKIKYKLFPRTSFTLDYKSKDQVSNLANSTYTVNTVTLSVIQIF